MLITRKKEEKRKEREGMEENVDTNLRKQSAKSVCSASDRSTRAGTWRLYGKRIVSNGQKAPVDGRNQQVQPTERGERRMPTVWHKRDKVLRLEDDAV